MKKIRIAALAGLAAVFAVGGSLAYFNQNLEAVNELTVGAYNTTVTENFNPQDGKNWEPGGTVKKEVFVKNEGDIPALARVWFTETWTRDGETEPLNVISSKKTDENNQLLPGINPDEERFTTPYQNKLPDGSPDGETTGDWTVVLKNLNLGSYWQYNKEDGCYYYTQTLNPDTVTESPLLKDITLIEDVDMGKTQEIKYYSTAEDPTDEIGDENGWIQFSPDKNGNPVSETELPEEITKKIKHFRSDITGVVGSEGYSGAKYTLSVTGQTVQATRSAVEATFGESIDDLAEQQGWNWEYVDEVLTNQ